MDIHYLTRDKIDAPKWNSCVDKAGNGLIYGYSFFLDHMADHWDALVLGDYQAVMPLPWKKKFGIYYLYQPFITAQLGIFGDGISAEIMESFFNSVPPKFKYWDLYLNHKNVLPLEHFKIYKRTNYILDLNRSYETIRSGYRDNIIRNTRKAEQVGCTMTKGFPAEQVVSLAIEQMNNYSRESKENVQRFRTLYKHLANKKMATTYGIVTTAGELVASAVFFFSHQRAYYILVGNHPNGRTIGASHALIDGFIKDNASNSLLLDFEGSDLRNLAFFYSSFGAIEELFGGVRLNKLPFYLKWVKKA